ncbi:molecular chaperone HtpG [Cephaloticoccus primus]|uniref:Chaperone protein HtpG n=1 Tax=Cephaloticoccus primus TaxID=1548207 RepID=A0A139SIY5_9BACT|nr:molecular chaperone HtpG [Cephaloticoccus primus]KXU34481.1 molecular chaperone HtpG [Cephaloticoccus primus]
MSNATPQKFEFQAEVKQLLDIVIHSLYTEKEVFVRELVSNASDALEKLRHTQITEKAIFDEGLELEINVTTDDKAKTITIQDFGIGMTREELVENLGTIAHSGSKAFLQALSEGGAKNSNLIGQFGVGFYSVFMAAESVRVYSRSWQPEQPGHVWTSDGSGSYEIAESEGERRGTKIVIKLKEDCSDFAQDWRLKEILERYSAFVSFPINLNGKRINTIQALWLRNKNEIKDEEYTEFYKFQAHAYDEPRLRLHFAADAPLTINALLFVPKENTEKLGFSRLEPSVALYCRKVLIDARPDGLLPEWLRFLKGVVDSEDLPLNISRETMQDKALIEKLGRVITKRFLKLLEDEAKNRPEAYAEFYAEFAPFLKEGAAMDFTHKEQLTGLLRFESSLTEAGKTTSLADYVSRMGSEQKEIYYLVGPNRAAIESGPYLEGFRARNLEVLFCYESVDEYVMNALREFDSRKLLAADHADVKLPDMPQSSEGALSADEVAALSTWLKDTLGSERVEAVSSSDRLVDSPVLATSADKMMSPHMRRIMKAMKQGEADAAPKVNLEINPRHSVIQHLHALHTSNPEKAQLVAEQLLDNALISAGLLDDASAMVARLNKLLASVN